MNKTTNEAAYRRIEHAAHYGAGSGPAGHDIEEWTFEGIHGKPHENVPANIPADAKYHCGYRDHGRQFWIYTRVAPISGGDKCQTCKRR